MRVTARALVRRWGGRAVGLAITGVGLYIVTPSLLSLFGAWPRLAEVQPRWFLLLVLLEAGSLASLWWLTRLALQPHQESDHRNLRRGNTMTRIRIPVMSSGRPAPKRSGARAPRVRGAPSRPRSWQGTRRARRSPVGRRPAGWSRRSC